MTTHVSATAGPELPPVASTGVSGLDEVLHGGFPREEMHLVQGVTGTGKTTLALRFLCAGLRAGEPGLYLTLSQSRLHLERIARSHGWDIEGLVIHELSPGTVASRIAARQTILPTTEVELGEIFRELTEVVGRVRPKRAVIDSITVLQMLAGTSQRYHREVVTVRQLFVERGATLLALADHPAEIDQGDAPETIFHPLSGCVIHLGQEARQFGNVRRRLRVVKARGLPSNGGYHDLKIVTGRVDVFPRLGAYQLEEASAFAQVRSGLETLDRMLGGGLETGTSCLVVGPSGVGKSSVASLYAAAAVTPEKRAAIFLFDERRETYLTRADGVGIPLRAHAEAGNLLLEQLDPGEIAPGEFAQRVRKLVEEEQIATVVIDSVVGYFAAMGSADVLVTQLHELLTFLTRSNVLFLMCGSQEGFMSIGSQEAVDVSYLSDTIIALNFFEAEAHLRRAVAVVKKKHSPHSSSIHELIFAEGHVAVGDVPLTHLGHLMVPRASRNGPGGDGEPG